MLPAPSRGPVVSCRAAVPHRAGTITRASCYNGPLFSEHLATDGVHERMAPKRRHKTPDERAPRTIRFLKESGQWETRKSTVPILPKAPPGREPIQTFSWNFRDELRLRPATLAYNIWRSAEYGMLYLPDTNFFLTQQHYDVWAALSQSGRMGLEWSMVGELKWWLRNPGNRNLRIHGAVMDCIYDRSQTIYKVVLPEQLRAPWGYYVSLLGLRKDFLYQAHSLLTEALGHPPGTQEVRNWIKNNATERALLLSLKGLEDVPARHRYNDERLVVSAFFHALWHGQETTILTSDEDVFEQFFKLARLLSTHYYSMLLAERYLSSLYRSSVLIPNPSPIWFQDDPILGSV